jgi:hypothetical protein
MHHDDLAIRAPDTDSVRVEQAKYVHDYCFKINGRLLQSLLQLIQSQVHPKLSHLTPSRELFKLAVTKCIPLSFFNLFTQNCSREGTCKGNLPLQLKVLLN